jgi:hypothetical protein
LKRRRRRRAWRHWLRRRPPATSTTPPAATPPGAACSKRCRSQHAPLQPSSSYILKHLVFLNLHFPHPPVALSAIPAASLVLCKVFQGSLGSHVLFGPDTITSPPGYRHRRARRCGSGFCAVEGGRSLARPPPSHRRPGHAALKC